MVEKDPPILHHTVTRSEAPKPGSSEKSILAPARFLSREIGGRAPGSPGERSASRYVEREFKALRLATEVQRFRTPVTTAWSEALAHFTFIAGVLLFPLARGFSYALVFFGFILLLLEDFGRSPFAWLQPHKHSENVIARIDARNEPVKTVVLVAHADSPRSAFYYRPGLVKVYRIFGILDFLCIALLFMLFTFIFAGSLLKMESDQLNLLWKIGLVPLLVPLMTLIGLSHKALFGKAIPGANDNASGIAVLMELARTYSRRRPQNIDLWMVSTGAADAGGVGIRRLLRYNRGQLKDAYFVVLDKVGYGLPVCFRKEGPIFPFRASRKLTSLTKKILDVHPHFSAGFKKNALYRGEGFQLLSRGKKAITISSREKSGHPRYWRWRDDKLDNLDPRCMRLCMDLVRAMIDVIDRGDGGNSQLSS